MEVVAYLASALIGISLGLVGGGGSILTVPVLVYLFGIAPLMATSYSLFIVGSTSLVGAYQNYKNGQVQVKTALLFGLSSVTTVWLSRKFLIPAIPPHIASFKHFELTENMLVMSLFAILMLIAAIAMIRSGKNNVEEPTVAKDLNLPKLLFFGVGIGFITGLLGAGGGFLLIPTLVILLGLPMKEAIGTSLFIIALNSLIGFSGDFGHFDIDWVFLLKITFIAIVGIFIGGNLSKKVDSKKLKIGFGWFVLIMSVYILTKELLFK
ncbi:sulfite exporter TauE/SafE family protein [Pedobacter sp. PLR]|uniref:sulfite exporter TauE/SafE family protein n=1 Tax=Pedobacter sp. PLR TaxID=2994465 RepID=UPI00224517D1|nr:sulfite exporter TauE/SafE family protein [Pedobacter sp. PLR]MCX2451563.1 sulfite exporter TauE/SafE family protein [Pedobacter sp. PLR]